MAFKKKKEENIEEGIEQPVNEEVLNEDNVTEGQNIEAEDNEKSEGESANPEAELKAKLEEKEKEAAEYLNMLKRTMADFDNYRKRTNKEKEGLYDDGFSDAVKQVLPVLDNLERAYENSSEENGSLFEGVKMVIKIFRDILAKSGIEEIKAEGETFDPDFHNAIMHVEDDSLGEGIIVEVLQKGYVYKGKVLRHSMVKVAN